MTVTAARRTVFHSATWTGGDGDWLRLDFPDAARTCNFTAMKALEFTRSGLVASLAVFLVAAACVRLGVWQLDRRDQRLERNAAISERLDDDPAALTNPPLDTVGLTHRQATVHGSYDAARTLVLGGRSHAGSPGVHVYAPLRIGDGAILVNRGWIPSMDAASVDLSRVEVDTAVTVRGVLMPLPKTGAAGPDDGGFRTMWFRLDADAVRSQYPYPVSPLYLQANAPDTDSTRRTRAGPREVPIPVPPQSLDAGPHLSYAVQWFSFAAIAVIGWGTLAMRAGRNGGRSSGTSA